MLQAARGIPAWREPLFSPLIVLTGLVEGGGAFFLTDALHHAGTEPLLVLFGTLVLARVVVWLAYRRRIAAIADPRALAALDRPGACCNRGDSVAARARRVAGARGVERRGRSAAAAWRDSRHAITGACFKIALVTRAGFNQGFALAHLPVRGARPTRERDDVAGEATWVRSQRRKSASARKRRSPQVSSTRRSETMPREKLAALQVARLRATLRNAYDHVPLHRARFDAAGIEAWRRPDASPTWSGSRSRSRPICAITIRSACSPARERELARLHASSGTTGKPTVVGYTQAGHRQLGRPDGAIARRRRGETRRHRAQRLWLRPLYRRAWRALRRRAAGRGRGAGLGRVDRAAGRADHGFPARECFAQRPRTRLPSPRSRSSRAWISRRARSRSGSSARSRGAMRCGGRSRRGWASRRSTSTGCPKSWAPASRANANARPACTGGRTISCSRSSTPRPARRYRKARRGSS